MPARRLARAVADAEPLRAANARALNAPRRLPTDALGAIRALAKAGVEYVLIGELAEVLHGSPLLPIAGTVTIVPRAGQRATLDGVIAASRGRRTPQPSSSPVDRPARWTLEAFAVDLCAEPSPPGTHRYEDLRRDPRDLILDEDVAIPVASLVDLVRIAEASPDRARVPALRRALELSSTPATQGAVPPEQDESPFQADRILEALARHRVRCVVIGGYAALLAGADVITRDIDSRGARRAERCYQIGVVGRWILLRMAGEDSDLEIGHHESGAAASACSSCEREEMASLR